MKIEWIPEEAHIGVSLCSPNKKVYVGTILKKEEYIGIKKFIEEIISDTEKESLELYKNEAREYAIFRDAVREAIEKLSKLP